MIPRMNLKLIDIVDSKNFGFQVHANQVGRKLKLHRENLSPESQHDHRAARDSRSREVLEKLALDQSSNVCVCVCVRTAQIIMNIIIITISVSLSLCNFNKYPRTLSRCCRSKSSSFKGAKNWTPEFRM